MTQKVRALFLDRDGVINVDHGYVHRPERFDFIDGIFDLCAKAHAHGWLIFVVTNQAGIARGLYTESQFWKLTEWMCDQFHSRGSRIKKVYFCPFHPVDGIGIYRQDSNCRKPKPGMILQAVTEYDINPKASLMVGDKLSDIEAGLAAGINQNLLFVPDNTSGCTGSGFQIVKRLKEVESFL
jgi:D-glycero-D-manno-heptose 1,7-bisphosphate phosphatase